MGVLSFRIYFGIARLRLINTALATLKQVQGDSFVLFWRKLVYKFHIKNKEE